MKAFIAVLFIPAVIIGGWFLAKNMPEAPAPEAVEAVDPYSLIPEATGHVNDYADIIPADVEASLEADLAAFPHQIAVLTVKSMNGLSIEEYGIKVGDKWKVGNAADDDGVILIVSTGERKVRIEVGSGAEAVLNDAKAGRILDEEVVPAFKQGDWASGIVRGVGAIKNAFKQ